MKEYIEIWQVVSIQTFRCNFLHDELEINALTIHIYTIASAVQFQLHWIHFKIGKIGKMQLRQSHI